VKEKPFEVANRCSFLELLRPPPGYRLQQAVGATYSLDFVTLTGAMLAFMDSEADDLDIQKNTVDILQALTRLSHRVRVFANRSQIHFSRLRESSPVFRLYDRIVREVYFEGSSFHPKLWLLRFQPKQQADLIDAPEISRIVSSSRNLTTATTWELAVCLNATPADGDDPIATAAGEFLATLREQAPAEDQTLLSELVASMTRMVFEYPKELNQGCQLLWQWPQRSQLKSSLGQGDRALVVSPFVRKTFMQELRSKYSHLTLITTRHELDQLDDECFDQITGPVFTVDSDYVDESQPSLDLHAKLYILEGGASRRTLIGSANASPSAWHGSNCEAMLDFQPGVSIKEFLRQFAYDSDGALRPWIREYTSQDRLLREPDTDDLIGQRRLDQVQAALAGVEFSASYDRGQLALRLSADPRAVAARIPTEILQCVAVSLCPLSLLEDASRDDRSCLRSLEQVMQGKAEFHKYSHDKLTEFLYVELRHNDSPEKKEFVVIASTDFGDLMAVRDTELLRSLLTPERFQQFLRAILLDGVGRNGPGRSNSPSGGGGIFADVHTFIGVSIEEVLRSCTEDPSRIDEITHLLGQFAGTDYVAHEFREFWEGFVEAQLESVSKTT
jgi:hypothetical protein